MNLTLLLTSLASRHTLDSLNFRHTSAAEKFIEAIRYDVSFPGTGGGEKDS
jgi:hypothetical protein